MTPHTAPTGQKRPAHGMSRTPTWRSWESMIRRCTNPNEKSYPNYGGRGITVCPEWRSFAQFYADMGERPAGMTLDRIDGNGNYEPGNCRWATGREQHRNRRNNRLITFNGETLCAAEWGYRLGGSKYTVRNRLRDGWPLEKALTEPVIARPSASRAAQGARSTDTADTADIADYDALAAVLGQDTAADTQED